VSLGDAAHEFQLGRRGGNRGGGKFAGAHAATTTVNFHATSRNQRK